MAENFIGDIFGGFGGWLNGFWMIVLLLIVLSILTLVFLLWNKKNKLIYPSFEVVNFGNGKVGLNKLSVGLFSKNRTFFNLIERKGEKDYFTNDNRPVQSLSTEDCHLINGKQGFLLKRKDGDSKILAPLNKVEITNYELLASIASGDYRDAASRIYQEKKQEMSGTWEKVAPLVIGGIIFIMCFIMGIITFQSSATQLEESRKFLLQCKEGVSNAASNAP